MVASLLSEVWLNEEHYKEVVGRRLVSSRSHIKKRSSPFSEANK